jgi:hypothetical protein
MESPEINAGQPVESPAAKPEIEQVVDTQEEVEEQPQDAPEKVAEEGKSVVRKLWDKIVGNGEVEDKPKAETKAVSEEDIDPEFAKAATKAGWTEDDVVKFAQNYTNAELKEMIPSLSPKEQEGLDPVTAKILEEAKAAEAQEAKKTEVEQKPVVPDSLKPILEQNEARRKKLDELEKRLGSVQENREMEEHRARLDATNKFFDKASDKFAVFGKTETLPRFPNGDYVPTSVAMKARSEVWKASKAFENMGLNTEQALEEALTWYKGKHMEKDVHEKVLKEFKRNEKRLSPKRTAKETVVKYENESEEKSAVVTEAMRRAGMTV